MSRPSSVATVAFFRGALRRGRAMTASLDVHRAALGGPRGNVDAVSLLFSFSFSIRISHDPFFLCGSSGFFARARTALLDEGRPWKDKGRIWRRPKGPRVRWLVPMTIRHGQRAEMKKTKR